MSAAPTRWFPNLKLSRKVALLCGLFSLPIVFLLYSLIQEASIAIQFSKKEVQGIHLLRPLSHLRLALEEAKKGKAEGLEQALNALKAAQALHGAGMDVERPYRSLTEALGAMEPAYDSTFGDLWNDYCAEVGDHSNLILDPDLDTYYTMDLVLLRIPGVLDQLNKASRSVSFFRQDHDLRKFGFEAASSREVLKDLSEGMARGVQIAMDQPGNEALRTSLRPLLARWQLEERALDARLADCEDGHCASLVQPLAQLHGATADLWAVGLNELQRLIQRRVDALQRKLWISLISVAAILALTLFAAWRLSDSVVDPIEELSSRLRAIVEEGDLRPVQEDSGQDEAGELSRTVAALVRRLREIPQALSASVGRLEKALTALDVAAQEQNQLVTRQAGALQETQVTAEEIKQTSLVATRSARSVLVDIGDAEEAGEEGAAALEKSLGHMSQILESVRGTASNISQLGERSERIGDIADTVKDLADQSNILALNAAIEALRSGVHGQGFGLVAREIRRLADQSVQSTFEVRDVLDGVRGAVSEAVGESESGARRVEASLAGLQASAQSLRKLSQVIRASNAAVRQIVESVGQQSAGVSQVFGAVLEQGKMMDETVKQLDNILAAVGTVKEVSQSLSDTVSKYKV